MTTFGCHCERSEAIFTQVCLVGKAALGYDRANVRALQRL
jgi:hypothetical protein